MCHEGTTYNMKTMPIQGKGVISQQTLNRTFEERGELPVNSEKEANGHSIQRKRQIGYQFKERVNQPMSLKKEHYGRGMLVE